MPTFFSTLMEAIFSFIALPMMRFNFKTVKPNLLKGKAPFLNVIVLMRGSLRHLHTRLYFSDETGFGSARSVENVFSSIPEGIGKVGA